jgi:hypothetical protein
MGQRNLDSPMGDLRFGGLFLMAIATTERRAHMIVYRCRPFEKRMLPTMGGRAALR